MVATVLLSDCLRLLEGSRSVATHEHGEEVGGLRRRGERVGSHGRASGSVRRAVEVGVMNFGGRAAWLYSSLGAARWVQTRSRRRLDIRRAGTRPSKSDGVRGGKGPEAECWGATIITHVESELRKKEHKTMKRARTAKR